MHKYNFEKVFSAFRDNYIEVPLEVFKDDPYKTLVSTLLSSRTKDEVTLEAAKKLFKKAPDIYSLKKLKMNELRELIYPVGFYNVKAKQLTKLANSLILDFKGKVPSDRVKLMRLPGVGRKTANLVLNRAFKVPAIAVDTHVHRISNLLGWVKTKNPGETENELNKILPEKYWSEINKLFVSIGRQHQSVSKLRKFLENNNLVENI